MKCPNCGAELPEGVAFCSSCGTKLEAVTQEAVPTPPPAPAPAQEEVPPQPQAVEQQVPPQSEPQSFGQVPPQSEPQNFSQVPPQGEPQNFGQVPPQGQPQNFGQVPPQGQPQYFGQVPPQGQQQNYGQVPPQGGPQYYGQGPSQGGYGQPMNQYGPLTPAKKSKTVPILIAVIGVALIATLVVLFVFVFNKGGGNSDVVGKYHAAAIEFSGMTLDISSLPGMDDAKAMSFDLQEDGNGTATVSGVSHPITWTLEGGSLDIIAEDGKSFAEAISNGGGKLEFKNNRIYCNYEENGMAGSMIFAKEGDTLSDIEMSTLADFFAKMGEGMSQ